MQTRAIIHGSRSATVAPVRSDDRIRSIARIVTIVGALFIEAILILGVVALSLGIGAEGAPGFGPDRPPPPPASAPAVPPDLVPGLVLPLNAIERSVLRGT